MLSLKNEKSKWLNYIILVVEPISAFNKLLNFLFLNHLANLMIDVRKDGRPKLGLALGSL